MTSRITTGVAAVLCLAGSALGGPFHFTHDYRYQAGYYYGDSTGDEFEIWDLGSRFNFKQRRLEFSIWQNMPEGGAFAEDSSKSVQHLSPGDLWITLGSRDPFAKAGVVRHAIALTTHGNVVQQKYPGEPWPTVTRGRLYKNAEFATGTFETYQHFMKTHGYWFTPDDRDGNDRKNSYLSLIKGFGEEAEGVSAVTWTQEDYWDWDEDQQTYVPHEAWRITGSVSLDAIGLWPGRRFSLFVSSECGNDGARHTMIPEPAGLLALAAGTGLLRRRRR